MICIEYLTHLLYLHWCHQSPCITLPKTQMILVAQQTARVMIPTSLSFDPLGLLQTSRLNTSNFWGLYVADAKCPLFPSNSIMMVILIARSTVGFSTPSQGVNQFPSHPKPTQNRSLWEFLGCVFLWLRSMLLKKTTQSNSRLQLTLDHENMLRKTSEKLVVSKGLGPEALPMDIPAGWLCQVAEGWQG